MAFGYEQYGVILNQTLHPPSLPEYGEASSDDLSSEWETEPDSPQPTNLEQNNLPPKPSGWRKVRNYVRCTPFVQTYKKHKYPWVQLAGHQGHFKAGQIQGTVLKKMCLCEQMCFECLMVDKVLRPFVPEYQGQIVGEDGETYLQLQDLLADFDNPCVMDCKIGIRTYLEDELLKAKENPKLRRDLYEKMIQIDPGAPTVEEHELKAITKPRYMIWRETISSTAVLGFRIEGIRKSDGTSTKDFKTVSTADQVLSVFQEFMSGFPLLVVQYSRRLKSIRSALLSSVFFSKHEMIGTSLLFVHDRRKSSIWMIDFAKTNPTPAGIVIDHCGSWVLGNHEDGYLIGLDNIINLLEQLERETTTKQFSDITDQ